MDHLADFLTVMSWFWLVLSLIVLGIMYKKYTDGGMHEARWGEPVPWIIVATASFSWLLVTL